MPSIAKESSDLTLPETQASAEPVADVTSRKGSEGQTEAGPDAGSESKAPKKKEPTLMPAPLPTKSPWKSVPTVIPVSSIPVESLEANKKKKNKTTTPVGSGTKWVPMKASIVVSGSKRNGNGGKKGSSKGNGGANSKANNASSKKKKQPQQGQNFKKQQRQGNTSSEGHEAVGNINEKQVNENSPNLPQEGSNHTAEQGEQVQSHSELEADAQGNKVPSNSEELASEGYKESSASSSQENTNNNPYDGPQGHHQQTRRQTSNNQSQHYPYQQNNFQRRRYYNNYNNNDAFKQQNFAPFQQQKSSFAPYQGRAPRSFNNGFRPRYQQQEQAMYQPYYNVQPIMVAINSIARQIEYYFSPENLNRDNYLRSKLSKEGYAPLALIAKFYRVVNMSFGGDSNLILAALKEISAKEDSNVEIALGSIVGEEDSNETEALLSRFFIRSKDWSSLLPEQFSTIVEIEKTLSADSLNEIVMNMAVAPVMFDSSFNNKAYGGKFLSNLEDDAAMTASNDGNTQVKNQ